MSIHSAIKRNTKIYFTYIYILKGILCWFSTVCFSAIRYYTSDQEKLFEEAHVISPHRSNQSSSRLKVCLIVSVIVFFMTKRRESAV